MILEKYEKQGDASLCYVFGPLVNRVKTYTYRIYYTKCRFYCTV